MMYGNGQMIPEAIIENDEEDIMGQTGDSYAISAAMAAHQNNHQPMQQYMEEGEEDENTEIIQDSARQRMTESEILDDRLN